MVAASFRRPSPATMARVSSDDDLPRMGGDQRGAEDAGGCLMVQAALAAGRAGETARRELAGRRAAGVAGLGRRLRRAIAEGDLPAGSDPATLARLVATAMHGMAVQAASGASRKELRQVCEILLRAWPFSFSVARRADGTRRAGPRRGTTRAQHR